MLIEENVLWFATCTSSRKVRHSRADPKACVYFCEKGRNFQGAELKGTMEVCADQATGERFWNPFFTRFYPDPDCCILKFTGFEAQWFASRRTQTIQL